MRKVKMDIARVAFLFILLFSFPFCSEELPRNTVPVAPVNLRIDLHGGDYQLQDYLSYKIFTEENRRNDDERFGFAGVFVVSVRLVDANLYAYDLCCPHEKKRDIVVTPNDDGTATCSTCNSVFVTSNEGLGVVKSGPSVDPLQRYNVIPIGTGVFRVVN